MGRREVNAWLVIVCASIIREAGRGDAVATIDVTATL